jgi:hypothetical protein
MPMIVTGLRSVFPIADPPLAEQNISDGNPYHLLQRHPVFDQEAAYREREKCFFYLLQDI